MAVAASIISDETEDLNSLDREHMRRVAEICNVICSKLGVSKDYTDNVYQAALLHDIGKKYIDTKILNKKGKLTEKEMFVMKFHVLYGAIDAINLGYSSDIIYFILYHHENYDGTGYFEKLKEGKIPLGARILKVADVFDALTSTRRYRKKLSIATALKIMDQEEKNFDPEIYQILKETYKNERGFIL